MMEAMFKATLGQFKRVIGLSAFPASYSVFLFVPDTPDTANSAVGMLYSFPDEDPSQPKPSWNTFKKPPGTTDEQWVNSVYIVATAPPSRCKVIKKRPDAVQVYARGGRRGANDHAYTFPVSEILRQPSAVY